jgi:hypothetical protein
VKRTGIKTLRRGKRQLSENKPWKQVNVRHKVRTHLSEVLGHQRARRAHQGLNRAHRRQWGDPRDRTPRRQGTDVPYERDVLSVGLL